MNMIAHGGTVPSIDGINERLSAALSAITAWQYNGEISRAALPRIGAEIEYLRSALSRMRMDAQFPSFALKSAAETTVETQERNRRRMELVSMVHPLPPSNVEIFDWLAEGNNKEAALLYAYSRGSASEPTSVQRTEFYDRVEALVHGDPLLTRILRVEALWRSVQSLYAHCQSVAYENMG